MKKQPIIFVLFAVLFVSAIFQSCEKDDEPMDVSYTTDVSTIMNDYCLTCHSGAAPEADLILDNYTKVREIGESDLLVDRTNNADDPMPPSGLIPEEKRQILKDWVAGGYQE